MKRSGVSLDAVADWHNLSAAFHCAALGKGQREEVIQFNKDLPAQLASLRQGILGEMLARRFKDQSLLALMTRIIDAHHAEVGRNKPALAGVSGKMAGQVPETVAARPYSGLQPTLDSTASSKGLPIGALTSQQFANYYGTTTRGTAVPRTVTTTRPTTVTTTLAFVAPELTTKPDGLNLNRPPSTASASRRQNPKAPGVLVAEGGCPANARRRAAHF